MLILIQNWFYRNKVPYFSHLEFVNYSHVEDKVECNGAEIYNYNVKDVSSCAGVCKNVSSLFVYGTNEFGKNRCKIPTNPEGCACACETAATPDGTCDTQAHNGFKLYKFDKGDL